MHEKVVDFLISGHNGFREGKRERTFLDVKVFDPYAPSNNSITPRGIHKCHENVNKRNYQTRIHGVEHATFICPF